MKGKYNLDDDNEIDGHNSGDEKNLEQIEIEEEENDEFESLYKGQISKSGIAILPSKRTRKIPEVKKVEAAEPQVKEAEPQVKAVADDVDEPRNEEPLTLKESAEVKE